MDIIDAQLSSRWNDVIPTTKIGELNDKPIEVKGYTSNVIFTNGSSYPMYTPLSEPGTLVAEYGSESQMRTFKTTEQKDDSAYTRFGTFPVDDAFFGTQVTVNNPVTVRPNSFFDSLTDAQSWYNRVMMDSPFEKRGNFKDGDTWMDSYGNYWTFFNNRFIKVDGPNDADKINRMLNPTFYSSDDILPLQMPFDPDLLSRRMPSMIHSMFSKLNPFKKQENTMCRETTDYVKKDAYMVTWENKEGQTQMRIPTKSDIGEGERTYDPCGSSKEEYLYDYKDIEKFIRKYLASEKSNILIAKVANLIEVKLHDID